MVDMHQDFKELPHILSKFGIRKGEVVYVASNITQLTNNARKIYGLKTTHNREELLNLLVDVLKEAVTSTGTLLFPVFTWDFCKGEVFDIKNSKGKVGAFNNWILLNRPDFSRTKHPLYSFMVWGKDSNFLLEMDNVDSFATDSPFGYLHKAQAKMLLIDVHLDQAYTFMHYIEEQLHVPYRYLKNFRSSYIDKYGGVSERSYTMFVRDLSIELRMHLSDDFLREKKAMQEFQWLGVPFRVVDLEKSYTVCKNDFLYNQGKMCYNFHDYELEWGKGQTHPDELNN